MTKHTPITFSTSSITWSRGRGLFHVGRGLVVAGLLWAGGVGAADAAPAGAKPAPTAKPAPAPKPAPPEPTISNMKYGDHERQGIWFWKAEGEGPRPLVVFIHGGGWLHGSAMQAMESDGKHHLPRLLKQGISVAAINFRYTTQAILPAPVHDAARAIQFLRWKADELNIDKTRIIARGGSAGGCTTLWLATHDDLADPTSEDPVARESTRLSGAWVGVPQTTLDPKVIREIDNEDALNHMMIRQAFGMKNNAELDAHYDELKPLIDEFSPVVHLDKNDPPMMLSYYTKLTETKDGIHNSRFGVLFKDRADEVGAPCDISLRQDPDKYPKPPTWDAFMAKCFGMTDADAAPPAK